jgi:hypothetical protein
LKWVEKYREHVDEYWGENSHVVTVEGVKYRTEDEEANKSFKLVEIQISK